MKAPSDFKMLWLIYRRYYNDFCIYDSDDKVRSSKIYVPIDCQVIANKLGVNGDIVFGRLKYHLANKYKYRIGDNETTRIFEMEVSGDRHCVNFPLLASVVADLRLQERRFRLTIAASVAAVVISLVSLTISGYKESLSWFSLNEKPVLIDIHKLDADGSSHK